MKKAFIPHPNCKSNYFGAGFTLIELTVAVSILVVGIIVVLRSFLAAATALDTCQNRIEAVRFAWSKMAEIELKAKENNGVETGTDQGSVSLGNRQAEWRIDITTVVEEIDQGDLLEEEKDLLNEVKLSVWWQESGKDKGIDVATYLPNEDLI